MRRALPGLGLLVLATLAGASASARAAPRGAAAASSGGPTRKVTIQTTPTGATVFIGDKESGAACKTPCTLDLPLGDAQLIVELEGYVPEIEGVSVTKARRGDKKPMSVRYQLTPAIGTFVVAGGPGITGAVIKIDGEDKGKAPARLQVPAVAHHVEVIAPGAGGKVFDDFVSVEAGAETEITPHLVVGDGKGKKGGGDSESHPDNPDAGSDAGSDTPATPPSLGYRPIAMVALVEDTAFRHFTYHGASPNLATYNERGQTAIGVDIALWPFARYDVRALQGVEIYAHIAVASISESVTSTNNDLSLTTYWHTYEGVARYRYPVLDWLRLGAEVGYELDQYEFSGLADQFQLVPDAEYGELVAGLTATANFHGIEPYITYDHDLVLRARLIGSTFGSTTAKGNYGAFGIAVRMIKHVDFGVEGSIRRYNWEIDSQPTAVTHADGAQDDVENIRFWVGGSY